MSTRIDLRQPGETYRSDMGAVAFCLGLAGASMTLDSVLGLASLAAGRPAPVRVVTALPLGLALLGCAIGLWRTRHWSRGLTTALLAAVLVEGLAELALGLPWDAGDYGVLLLTAAGCAYLLLPFAARRLARLRGR